MKFMLKGRIDGQGESAAQLTDASVHLFPFSCRPVETHVMSASC